MPKRIQPLSDIKVKNAKSKDKDHKLSDGFGLHLLVTTLLVENYSGCNTGLLTSSSSFHLAPTLQLPLQTHDNADDDARKLLAKMGR